MAYPRLIIFAVFILVSGVANSTYYCAWNAGFCMGPTARYTSSPEQAAIDACSYLKSTASPPFDQYYNYAGITGTASSGYSFMCWPMGSEIRDNPGDVPNCAGGSSLAGQCSCPAGQSAVNGVCQTNCPSGKVQASSIPGLNTASTACVDPSIQRCDSIGYNPNDLVPVCSQLVQGSPATCFQSEYPETQLPQCPELTCEDGSKVTYPTPCPVVNCPDGFTLASLGNGYGNSCVKELPPEDPPNPDKGCITVPGKGSETVCADANNSECGKYNGDYICLAKKDTPEPGDTCITKSGVNLCVSNQPKVQETTNKTQNPDGSTTEVTQRETNIKGDTQSTTVRTCTAAGNCTTTSTDTSKDQSLAALKAIEKNTLDTSNKLTDISKALKAPAEGFTGETAGDENSLYQKTDKTMQGLYSDFLSDIQTQPLYQAVQTAFVASFSSCACPVFETGNISLLGASFNFRFDQFCSETFNNLILPTVQAVIGILAALVAIKFAFF